jgi:hypothetical protein
LPREALAVLRVLLTLSFLPGPQPRLPYWRRCRGASGTSGKKAFALVI